MANKELPNRSVDSLGAQLVIAGVLEELRTEPRAFARLLVAVSQVREADVARVARLLQGDSRLPTPQAPEDVRR